MAAPLFLLVALSMATAAPSVVMGGAVGSMCPRMDPAFLGALSSRCPVSIDPSLPPLEVDGETLDTELGTLHSDTYYALIFYASWCPFSRNVRPAFDSLSLMFPQIRHLAVEELSSMPIVFSRYGVHSFPKIILGKGTTKFHFRGPKDISSLVQFYKEITGLDASNDFVTERSEETAHTKDVSSRSAFFSAETIAEEPYLVFGFLFLLSKMLITSSPKIFSLLRAFLLSRRWHPNMGMLTEHGQLLERILHVIDAKKLRSNLKLCNKSRNFQKGAKNARVWASSLASVSLGEVPSPSSSLAAAGVLSS